MLYTLAYITDLVSYTCFHWFFNPECQHIFGKQTVYISVPQKDTNIFNTVGFCIFKKPMVKSVIYLLFSYQTGYIMWHSRLRIYIPFGCTSGNIEPKPGMSHYIPCLIAEYHVIFNEYLKKKSKLLGGNNLTWKLSWWNFQVKLFPPKKNCFLYIFLNIL